MCASNPVIRSSLLTDFVVAVMAPAMQAPLTTAIWSALSATAGVYFGTLVPFGGAMPPNPQAVVYSGKEQACVALGSSTIATLNNTPIVTVLANGTPLVLILDTGAQRTVVTPAAAKRIGGKTPRVEFQREVSGIAAALPSREIELQSFSIREVAIPWHRITVAPIATPPIFLTALDGSLGADVLSAFDIDLDLPHKRITLYAPGHCGSPNWSGHYAMLETGRSRSDHLFFPVLLDDHPITAIIDTGAQHTVLSAAAARLLGVTETALARDRPIKTRGAAGEELNSRVHKFGRLSFASLVIRDPEIVVSDLHLRDADIILGMDFLQTHRIWLSYASFHIFLAKGDAG